MCCMTDNDFQATILWYVVVIWSDVLGDIQWRKAALSRNPSHELAYTAT